MNMRLGCNPLCWMNTDFPQMEGQVPVDQCLSEIATIGYEGVEMEDPFLKVLDKLPGWLKARGLECIGKWHSTNLLESTLDEELERLDRHCDMLEKLGAKVVNLAECTGCVHQDHGMSLSRRPVIGSDDQWERLCDGLEVLARHIKNRGMVSAYHHHMGTVVQSAEDIDRLMAGTQTLGLLYDTGHLLFAKADPIAVLKAHASRISHVHCKSVRPSVLEEKLKVDSAFFSSVLDGVFTVPGERDDIVDYDRIIETLKSAGYCGWLVVEAEQDPSKADPFTYAQLGYETLHSILNTTLTFS